MKTCKKCGSKAIKSRTNYSHGQRSKATVVLACKDCGSQKVDVTKPQRRRRRR